MGDAMVDRYWCHSCTRMVNPILEAEITCPFCESGFVEEMGSTRDTDTDLGSDQSLSLLAPMLLWLIGGHSPPRPHFTTQEHSSSSNSEEEEAELERELESLIQWRRRRRRSSSASVLRMLRDLRSGMALESENSETDSESSSSVILVDPFNEEAVILQGSFDLNQTQNTSYLTGPGLDLLLEHLAENEPNRYGTPPAQKEAVEAMPTVTIDENYQCSVCLEDFEIGDEAKEMPCKHKFHCGCIIPWLELHSSCPVCRLQMPFDDSKIGTHGSRESNDRAGSSDASSSSSREEGGEGRNGNGRGYLVPVPDPVPFIGFFLSSGSQSGGNSSSASSAATPGNASRTDEN